MAYEKQVCMENWPAGVKAPGPGFSLKKLEHSALAASNELRQRAIAQPDIDDFVRIVPWSEGLFLSHKL